MFKLSKLLDKFGVQKESDLSIEEKVTFDQYKKILVGETVTVNSLKEFCKSQIRIIETKIADGINRPTDIQLSSLHVYLNLLKAIEAPEAERESLENYLNQLIQ